MRYHNITKDDMLNGDGLRVVLWVSGCSHKCDGCHNPITWDSSKGLIFGDIELEELREQLSKDYISGITLSGGDPLFIENRADILKLVRWVKTNFPTKTIWLYSGYTWEQVLRMHDCLAIMRLVDIFVDGPFINRLKDNTLMWKGSSNQRVIDVQKSLLSDKIVLHCGDYYKTEN